VANKDGFAEQKLIISTEFEDDRQTFAVSPRDAADPVSPASSQSQDFHKWKRTSQALVRELVFFPEITLPVRSGA
jgi:hypothetical protein